MQKVTINSSIIPISLIALSSLLMHASQLDGAIVLACSNINKVLSHHVEHKVSEPIKETHTEVATFSVNTFYLRSQPPSARPREDDENDQKNNLHIGNDDFSDTYSVLTS